jgi:hypothetical protein
MATCSTTGASLLTAPSSISRMSSTPKKPFKYMYDLGERNLYGDMDIVNEIIKKGKLGEYKKLL